MKRNKIKGILGLVLAASVFFGNTTALALSQNGNGSDSSIVEGDDSGILKVDVDDAGLVSYDLNSVNASESSLEDKQFSWDNASVYFTLTDRFKNGDTSNDHSYGRSVGEVDAGNYQNRMATFHGGDLKGLTDEVENGYFDKLGVNAIWITAPYEQIHGAICGQGFKHYAYHGYYTLDYTNVDANMGTAEDLHNFIDTAHSHGIRVVFDVVMNHAGYADPVTANEYGFGSLNYNWKDIYYGWNESQYRWYNDYAGEASNNGSVGMMNPSADWNTKWWGSEWLRAVGHRFNGYSGSESGDEKTMCLSGLPDFRTESNNSVSVPGILKTKWQREGRYEQEVDELNKFFNRTGKQRTVKNYLVKWLSDWVREYGVDGFRCDTAKHVNLDCWADLKTECKLALKEWRRNNPDKPGSDWTDEFWMTGEVFDHGVYKDNYFTSGGFDSLINFAYMSKAFASTSVIDNVYSEYAGKINNDDNFNVLSYISSHDKGLSRGNMITAGTNLLLLPGAVQIYYGDETNRKAVGSNAEQGWRSQMNWDSIDENSLSHWQKVGLFRSNHIAVGGGTHTKISDAPYTFSRVYDKKGIKDKVVVAETGSSGNYSISIGNVFNNGDGVRDAYTGKEYVVSNGMVQVQAGNNGLVLLESNGVVESSVGISPESKDYYTDSVSVTLSANNVKSATYSVDGIDKGTYTNGENIKVGQDKKIGEKTIVEVNGVDKDGKSVGSKKVVYTKVDVPDFLTIHVKNDSWTSAPNAYVYSETGTTAIQYTGAWPGETMISEGDGWYTLKVEETIGAKVIFNGSWGQYPLADMPGLDLEGEVWVLNNEIVDKPVNQGTVNIKYVNKDTGVEIVASTQIKGAIGSNYSVSPKSISGYTLENEPNNVTGTFTEEDITVIYEYSKNVVSDTLIVHAKNDRWTTAPNAYVYGGEGSSTVQYAGVWPGTTMTAEGDGWYTFSTDKTASGKIIFNGTWGQYPSAQMPGIDVSGEVWILNNVIVENPNKTGSVTVKYIDEDISEEITEDVTMKGKIGAAYTTSVKTIDGYELSSTPVNAKGEYTEGNTVVTYKYKKIVKELKITDFTAKDTGISIQLAVETTIRDNITYSFWAYNPEGEWELISKSSENVVNWSPVESGDYVLWVYAKDKSGKSVYKTLDYTVKSVVKDTITKIEENHSI